MRQLSRYASSALLVLASLCLWHCASSAWAADAIGNSTNPPLATIQAPQGLIGWWKGEGNVMDSAGSANGYVTNGASFGIGEVGVGFSLDGTNNRVVIPSSPALNFGSNQNYTVEAWIQAYPTPDNYQGIAVIVGKSYTPDPSSCVGWFLYIDKGKLGILISQAPMSAGNSSFYVASDGPNVQDGMFHHVAVTMNRNSSTGGKLYVDGNVVLAFDPSLESGDLSTTTPLYVGSHDNPSLKCNFKGIIDDLSIYNRDLVLTEISSIYMAGRAGKVSSSQSSTMPLGIVGWWKGEGNVVDGINGANGYTTNGASYGPGKVGTGFSLVGTNNRVIVPNAPMLNLGASQNFSIELWMQAQPTPGNYNGIAVIADKAVRPDSSTSTGWQLYLEYGQIGFQLLPGPISSQSRWTAPGINLQDGLFHHVAVTVNRTSQSGGRLFVDGNVVLTFDPTLTSQGLSTNGILYIGSHGSPDINAFFKGIIDEVSVYNRDLTATEINTIYKAAGVGKSTESIAPFIYTQPAGGQVVKGRSVTLDVGNGGTPPLAYQWKFNGINISGATNNTLLVESFQPDNAGNYTVEISNAMGSITSSNAALTVKLPLPAPQGLVGWWKGESNVMDSASIANGYETNGAGYGSGRVGTGFNFDGVDDRVVVPNNPTLNFGTNQNFSIEAWIQAQPTPDNLSGYTVIADKALPRDAGSVVGWMFYMEYGRLGFLMSQAPMTYAGASYWEAPGPDLQDGLFHHVAVTVDRTSSTGGKLYVDGSEVMTFNPTGENGDLSSVAPLRIGNHNNPDLACNFKGIIDELSVYNRQLTAADIRAIYETDSAGKSMEAIAPSIIAQPAGQSVAQGSSVTIDIGFIGTQPLTYQWNINGTNISAATNSSLVLTNFQTSDAGAYAVVISNAVGSITSSNALLTFKPPMPSPQGLVGWWKGEGNVADSAGNANGYVTNGAGYGPGEVGTGFSLDGVDDRVIISNTSALNFDSNRNFTIEAWIQAQPTPGNYNGITVIADKAVRPDSSTSTGWQLYLEYGQLGFQLLPGPLSSQNRWTAPGINLQDGLFHHVAATVDRTSHSGGKLFVDGRVVLSFDPTLTAQGLSTNGVLYIGSHGSPDINAFFKGIIDEVSIYNRELTTNEIYALYRIADAGKTTAPSAPAIIAQLASQQVVQGRNVTLDIGVVGTQPFAFQWSYNGTNIDGATNKAFSVSNFNSANEGAYAVTVSNALGSVTSSNAVLTLKLPITAPEGLVGWWSAEGNVLDNYGKSIGYTTNGAGYGQGEVGTGFSLDGKEGRVIVPNASLLDFGTNQNFSVEAWIQVSNVTAPYYGALVPIAAKTIGTSSSGSVGWALCMQNGCLGLQMSQAPLAPGNISKWISGSPNLQDGKFHHIAATVNRTSITGGRLYVDGKVVRSFDPTIEKGDLSTSGPLYIGGYDNATNTASFKGILDELSVYNRAMASNEIAAIYQSADAGKFLKPFAPIIITQPSIQQIAQGGNVKLEFTIAGTEPLTYQWFFNGANIASATNKSLVLTNVQLGDAGAYAVSVTNALGSATSSNAVLTVVLPITAPQGLIGWWRGESNVVDEFTGSIGYETNGAGFATGEVGTGFSFDGTNSQVVIPDSPTLNFGSNQNFSVEAWIQAQPFAQPTYPNYGRYSQNVSIAAKSFYSMDLMQEVGWKFSLDNGSLLFMMTEGIANNINPTAWMTTNTVITDSNFHHVAATVDRTSKTGGKLYVDGNLVLTFDPSSQNGDLSNTSPLLVGTKLNMVLMPGPMATFNYFKGIIDEVTVYNRALSSNEIAVITQVGIGGKFMQPTAPIIATQPASQRIVQGNDMTLVVGAGGTQPLTYQWQFNGSDMASRTNSSLVLTNIQFIQAGAYSVKVSNALGSVTSSNALIRVDFPPATVLVANASGSASAPITVPVVLLANGNENAVSFSVNFDPAILTFAKVVKGSGAIDGSLLPNTNLVGTGKLGLILALDPGTVFSAGTQEVVKVSFNVATTQAGSTLVTFGNQPTLSQLSDVDAITLAANYEDGTVSIAAADFEGDVTPRPSGDRQVTLTDWVQEGRYVARLDNPAGPGEYQRADCAPQATRGDGAITVIDWVQAGRYAVGLDPLLPVGGPSAEILPIIPLDNVSSRITETTAGCEVKIVELNLVQGQSGTVSVVLEAQGTENALGFSLAFDPTAIRLIKASRGSDATDSFLNVNTNDAASGRVGVALSLSPGQTFGTGAKEILKLSVQVAASAATGQSTFTFTDVPVTRVVSDVTAIALIATFTQGVVDVDSSIPTLRINRLNDQVVLSWPDWATNYVLQVTGNSGTNMTWTNSAAASILTNGASVVTLPASAQTELYRLIQIGSQGGNGSAALQAKAILRGATRTATPIPGTTLILPGPIRGVPYPGSTYPNSPSPVRYRPAPEQLLVP